MKTKTKEKQFRLPKNIVPKRYEIKLSPDLEHKNFMGEVLIEINVLEKTNLISLNAIELDIKSCELNINKKDNVVSEWKLDKDVEILRINLKEFIEIGSYKIFIQYKGILNEKLRGFYHSSFKDAKGKLQSIATTQMESTDARRSFPCFDEPNYKAIFSITLDVKRDLYAVSNSEIKKIIDLDKDKKRVEFVDTIPMSTYLVAFIVGPFKASRTVDVSGVPLRIIYPEGKDDLCDYALDVGEFALKYFSDYYKIPYPGDKLDMIAIPDFAFGAMENLGCITYREALLLVDENKATSNELMRIADVICHEIAHMWFGDLVTMKWWNGIWLNEAFATFMATKAVAEYNVEWNRWAQFSLEKSMAMDIDSLLNTRPIEYPVITPSDADGMFDLITYEKGGSILRMLEQFLGEQTFRDGVSLYLTEHSYSNTETDDLWKSLEIISKQPVKEFMDSWVFQPGHPIINVSVENKNIVLNQSSFKYIDSNNKSQKNIWGIPLVVKISNNDKETTKKILFDQKELCLDFKINEATILFNANAYGFYRVDPRISINDFLDLNKLNSQEKYTLIDDLWSLNVNGSISSDEFIDFTNRFNKETDPDILSLVFSCLSSLHRIYFNSRNKKLENTIESIFNNSYELLQLKKKKSIRDIQAISICFRALGMLINDKKIIEKSLLITESYMKNNTSDYEPDIISSAISISAYHGNKKLFDKFVHQMKNLSTPQDELRYQRSLTLFQGENEMNSLFDLINSDTIRSQDAPYLLASALTNINNGWLAWKYIKSNWEILKNKFPENSLVRMLSGIRSLNRDEYFKEIKTFFANDQKISQGQLQLKQHLEKLEINVNMRFRELNRG